MKVVHYPNGVPTLSPYRITPVPLPPRRAGDFALALASWGLLLAVALPVTFWLAPEMMALRRDMAAQRQFVIEQREAEAARAATREAIQRRLVEREMDLLKAQRDNLKAADELAHRLRGE